MLSFLQVPSKLPFPASSLDTLTLYFSYFTFISSSIFHTFQLLSFILYSYFAFHLPLFQIQNSYYTTFVLTFLHLSPALSFKPSCRTAHSPSMLHINNSIPLTILFFSAPLPVPPSSFSTESCEDKLFCSPQCVTEMLCPEVIIRRNSERPARQHVSECLRKANYNEE